MVEEHALDSEAALQIGSTEFTTLTAELHSMQVKISSHQASIEEKIVSFQQTSSEDFNKMKEELKADSARSDARMEDLKGDGGKL